METKEKVLLTRLKRCDIVDLAFMESSWQGNFEEWENKIVKMIRTPEVFGIVAREISDEPKSEHNRIPPAGYCLFRTNGKRIRILRIVTDPWLIGQGIGTAMIDYFRTSWQWPISVDVPEENLAAQMFFKANGFLALRPNCSVEPVNYRMVYKRNKDA